MMAALFEISWIRFAISGTLIAGYAFAGHLARRRETRPSSVLLPPWVRATLGLCLLAFYLLIGPTGGPLWRGLGNLAGGAMVAAAMRLRLSSSLRYPELSGRILFSSGLPLAVGAPWGLAVLGLPALMACLFGCHRADRLARLEPGASPPARYRLLPGIW